MLFKTVEVELSSYCNASCPGCARTQMLNKGRSFSLNHLNETILFQRFQKLNLENCDIDFYGVLGDPLMHPKILNIVKWFLDRGSKISISTNASLRSENFYYELAQMSFQTKRLELHFAVDGLEDTNSIYRVNTSYKIIQRNMKSYSRGGGLGSWFFIEFDHNFHQKEEARKQAHCLNLKFFVKRNTRNEISSWPVKNSHQKANSKPRFISHKKGRPHPKIEEYRKIIKGEINSWNPSSISCVFVHKQSFFLANNGTVWPCCYLWDEYVTKKNDFHTRMDEDFPDQEWNSIYKNDFNFIFQSAFYQNLSKLWEEKNRKFTKRCYKSCSAKGMLRTQVSTD